MDLTSQVTRMGGACRRRELVALRGRAEVDAALRRGTLVATARGRYALAISPTTVRRASAVDGVLSHRSAAQHWGWAQKQPPSRVEVTVPRERRLAPTAYRYVLPHWADLDHGEVDGVVTTRRRTLIDCMRNLPLDESLPIVDSAIRADDVTQAEVRAIAESTRGRGRARILAVADVATGRAANPFESVLHAQALLVPGLYVTPQLPVRLPGAGLIHPDLGDRDRRIALEAEGFESHSDPRAFTRDCRRYNDLALLGWLVLRFTWYLVMHRPAYVHQALVAAAAGVPQPANVA